MSSVDRGRGLYFMLSASRVTGGGDVMDEEYALQRLTAIADELRAIRERICDPRSNENPRYHGLSLAVSGIKKAQEDIRSGL
jgi:hypothetical protein